MLGAMLETGFDVAGSGCHTMAMVFSPVLLNLQNLNTSKLVATPPVLCSMLIWLGHTTCNWNRSFNALQNTLSLGMHDRRAKYQGRTEDGQKMGCINPLNTFYKHGPSLHRQNTGTEIEDDYHTIKSFSTPRCRHQPDKRCLTDAAK